MPKQVLMKGFVMLSSASNCGFKATGNNTSFNLLPLICFVYFIYQFI